MQRIIIGVFSVLMAVSCASFKNPLKETTEKTLDENQTFVVVDQIPFTVKDFLYVFNKNKNLRKPQASIQADVDQYLELFVNFRLKIREAEALGYDQKDSFKRELDQYHRELAEPFLTTYEFTNEKVKEAYERFKYEVRASHILLRHSGDTLKDLERMNAIHQRVKNGEDFASLAVQLSEDPSVKVNKGDLGYFSIRKMVKEFEDQAFTTPIGGVSEPFTTRFGHHILKVYDKIPARGRLQVAHILVQIDPRSSKEEDIALAYEKAMRIYNNLQEGEDWVEQCRLYSDHKPTADKEGVIPEFGAGQMNPDFEQVAFALSKDQAYSEPVRTTVGWHIIKLIEKKPQSSFKEVESRLKSYVRFNLRQKIHQDELVQRLKSKYNFQEAEAGHSLNSASEELPAGNSLSNQDRMLFQIGDTAYRLKDYNAYLKEQETKKSKGVKSEDLYDQFVKDQLLTYEKENLALVNDEYKYLSQEYHDGILLFQLMQDKVWNFASEDTLGLQNFLRENQKDYQWEDRVRARVISSEDSNLYKELQLSLQAVEVKRDRRQQLKYLQQKFPDLSSREGIFNHDDTIFNQQIDMAVGVFTYQKDGRFYYVDISEILEAKPQELNEIRGTLIADYQDHIEKSWLDELKKKYEVQVDQKVLKGLYRRLAAIEAN